MIQRDRLRTGSGSVAIIRRRGCGDGIYFPERAHEKGVVDNDPSLGKDERDLLCCRRGEERIDMLGGNNTNTQTLSPLAPDRVFF